MRVLIISPRFNGGGAERSARELFESLQAAGNSVSMLVAIRQDSDPALVSQTRLPGERYLQAVRKVFWPVDWIHVGSKWALRQVTRDNCDVVHFHNLHGSWMSLKAMQALCRRMPTVWTLHDEWAASGLCYDLSHVSGKYGQEIRGFPGADMFFPETKNAQKFRRFLKRRLPQPELLICPSEYMLNLTRRSGNFPDSQWAHVPYGLRFKELPAVSLPRVQAKKQMGMAPEDRVVLLAAANLNSCFKGVSLAIDALRELPATAFKVLVIGSGGELIAQRIPQQVVATGFLSDDNMIASAYRAADLTLVPSIADNFPYVALESMACATPVAAFKVGGLVEMVGENERGMLATAFDVSEYARNIKVLSDSTERREQLGNAGRNWIEKNCDMASWTNRHLELYRRILNSFGKQGAAIHLPAEGEPN